VALSAPSSLVSGPVPGLLYHREQRDGKTVLVETAYEIGKIPFGPGALKPTGESLYPGDGKLVYTGPWVTGVIGMGFQQITLKAFATYLLRPLDGIARRATPRMMAIPATTVMAGVTAPSKSGTPAKAPLLALTKPQTSGQDCGVKFSPESAADPNELRGLACLLLTQDGQGITLPDGTKLFRRWGVIEQWKGDVIIQSSPGVVARDAQQRYWFLEFKGWL
jgi:hypothetical protein